MTSRLVQKLTGVRDLKTILETTVRELGDTFQADSCQVILSNPLDPNVTSICEYQADKDDKTLDSPKVTVPLVLQGRTFGSVSMAREQDLSNDEVNALRVLLGELGDIIRLAQINDVVQRDTFRETFLVEIGNVMSYSLGIGDALFMVVNILGKALEASRCLFICTDDAKAGWKCYEFWKQDQVKSCQEYYWPSNNSPFVAQALLSPVPLIVNEGQLNSYVSPVQEELNFIGVKSLLGVPLTSSEGTHGCVILQQCDYRRAWTRQEIDMVQNVADRVAEALLKLPPEKLVRQPIMQLHQRTIAAPDDDDSGGRSSVDVRRALKGALGQQAIPSARAIPEKPKPKPKPPTPTPPPEPAKAAPVEQQKPVAQEAPPTPISEEETLPPKTTDPATIVEKPARRRRTRESKKDIPEPTIKPVASVKDPKHDSITGIREFNLEDAGKSVQDPASLDFDPATAPPTEADPYADLDFGDMEEVEAPATPTAAPDAAPAETAAAAEAAAPATPTAAPDAAPTETAKQAEPATPDVAPKAAEEKSALDSIPAPKTEPAKVEGGWGDLDSIPTPKKGASKGAGGLKGSMLAKAKASSAASPLMSSLKKGGQEPAAEEAPAEPIDEEAAQKKIDALMAAKDDLSDYIFSTPGLDPRMLGRIDGWVSQIEEKDKYKNGHARQVAEYSIAIAKELGKSEEDINIIRQAALVHDLGKLGIAKSVLQKDENSLEPDEFVLKMGHSVAGSQLLESFPDLEHLAKIVHSHHEEVDGQGFPQGLKSEEIPEFARIIAVANGYHELVADKVFADGIAAADAQKQIKEEAGKLFDQSAVDALLKALKEEKVPGSM